MFYTQVQVGLSCVFLDKDWLLNGINLRIILYFADGIVYALCLMPLHTHICIKFKNNLCFAHGMVCVLVVLQCVPRFISKLVPELHSGI